MLTPGPDGVKWYYPLEGDIRKAQTIWDSECSVLTLLTPPVFTVARMTTLGKFFTQNTVYLLEKVGFVPKGTYDVGESLKVAAEALVAGGRAKLFTPMALWVVRKVSNSPTLN